MDPFHLDVEENKTELVPGHLEEAPVKPPPPMTRKGELSFSLAARQQAMEGFSLKFAPLGADHVIYDEALLH